jgi:hypothetical protein
VVVDSPDSKTELELNSNTIQFLTLSYHPVQAQILPPKLSVPDYYPTSWSSQRTSIEALKNAGDLVTTSENLVRILQHHFPSADSDVVTRVVQMVAARVTSTRSISSAPSCSTTPETGFSLRQNRHLKNSGNFTYDTVDGSKHGRQPRVY